MLTEWLMFCVLDNLDWSDGFLLLVKQSLWIKHDLPQPLTPSLFFPHDIRYVYYFKKFHFANHLFLNWLSGHFLCLSLSVFCCCCLLLYKKSTYLFLFVHLFFFLMFMYSYIYSFILFSFLHSLLCWFACLFSLSFFFLLLVMLFQSVLYQLREIDSVTVG